MSLTHLQSFDIHYNFCYHFCVRSNCQKLLFIHKFCIFHSLTSYNSGFLVLGKSLLFPQGTFLVN